MAANNLTIRKEYCKFSKCYISFLLRCEGFLLDGKHKFEEEFTKPISIGLVITARELKHLFDKKIETNCDAYTRDFNSLCCYICTFATELNRRGVTDWAPIMAIIVFCGELVLRIVRARKYKWINVIIEVLAQMLSLYHNIIVHFGGFKGLQSYCIRTFIGPEETTEAETAQEPGPSGIKKKPRQHASKASKKKNKASKKKTK